MPNQDPQEELEFLQDQRKKRKMYIGSINIETTRALERKQVGMAKRVKFFEEQAPHEPISCSIGFRPRNISQPSSSKTKENQMRYRLENLATACDRTGVSDRSASLIASAVLQDVGLISNEDTSTSQAIDRNKQRRERRKVLEKLQNSGFVSDDKKIVGLYFDGRKDKTIFAPPSGTACSLKNGIIEFLNIHMVDVPTLVAIGCDGTAVNTRSKNCIDRETVESTFALVYLLTTRKPATTAIFLTLWTAVCQVPILSQES
nr:unnamed protein product [Callosobruchus analis]